MDFEIELKKMADKRILERQEYYNSNKWKIKEIIIDFKCWAFSKGIFYNLDEKLFNTYKKETHQSISFDLNMSIFEEYFGYKFQYDPLEMKWKTIVKGKKLINYTKNK